MPEFWFSFFSFSILPVELSNQMQNAFVSFAAAANNLFPVVTSALNEKHRDSVETHLPVRNLWILPRHQVF